MRDEQIRQLEKEVAELERLAEAERSGEISDEDQARLDRMREKAESDTALTAVGAAVALAVVVVAGLWWWIGADNRESERQATQRDSTPALKSGAAYACAEFVKRQLKAPTTAQFPRQGRGVSEVSSGVFEVSGQVDAQNSFGAQLRHGYFCRVKLEDGDWLPVDVRIHD